MLGPTKKKMLHVQGQRRSPSKMVGQVKSYLESNPIPTTDARRAQTKPCVHQETPQRQSLNVSSRGTGQQWMLQGQGLWVQQAWVWHKPSWRRSPLTPPQSHQNLHRTGETDSWRAQTEPCVHQDPGERSTDSTSDWPRLACECGKVPGEVWLAEACCRVAGTECGSLCMGPFEGSGHYLHYLHHSLVSGQTTGREHSPTHQQKIGLKIYWAWSRPSEQDQVSPSISLSHQEAPLSLLSFSTIGQTEWKPQSQKTNQTDHMDHSLA